MSDALLKLLSNKIPLHCLYRLCAKQKTQVGTPCAAELGVTKLEQPLMETEDQHDSQILTEL